MRTSNTTLRSGGRAAGRRSRRLLATLAAGSLALAACGGDDSDGDTASEDPTESEIDTGTDTDNATDTDTDPTPTTGDDPETGDTAVNDVDAYAETLAAEFMADPGTPFTQDEADCVAQQFVNVIGGPEVFLAAGVTPEDFAQSEAPLADTDLEFTDEQARQFGASFSNCGVNFVDLFADGMGELPDEAMQCLREQMTDEVIGQMFVMLNQEADDTALDTYVLEALEPCVELMTGG